MWFSFEPNLTLLRPIRNFVETNFFVSTDFFSVEAKMALASTTQNVVITKAAIC